MPSRLVLLDWSLIDRSGHAFEYDSNVMRAFAAQEWQASIYAHRDCRLEKIGDWIVRRWFSIAPTETVTRCRALRPLAKLWAHWRCSSQELRAAVAEADGADTLFFIQHAEAYHLPAIACAFRASHGRLMLMLRATSLTGTGERQRGSFRTLLYRIFLPAVSAALGDRLLLITDSTRLQAEFAQLVRHRISVVPIPNPVRAVPSTRPHKEAIHVLVAGRMSFEKGIQYVPALIKKIRELRRPIVFHVHIYHHTSEASVYDGLRTELEALEGNDVMLVRSPLSTETYWAQTAAADVSLLLYDTGRYRNQTSNLVLDALACGTYPIVSDGTWLADTVRTAEYGTAVAMENKADIVSKVAECLSKPLPEKVPEALGRLLSYHTARSFQVEVLKLLSASDDAAASTLKAGTRLDP